MCPVTVSILILNVFPSAKFEMVRCDEIHADFQDFVGYRKIINYSKCQCDELLQYKNVDLHKTSHGPPGRSTKYY